MKRTPLALTLLAAVALALPVAAKDKTHGQGAVPAAAGCPPGLARKSPACLPPGLAKRPYGHDDRTDRRTSGDHYDGFRYNDRYDNVYRYRIGDRLSGDYILIPAPAQYGLDPNGTYYRADGGVYQVNGDTMEVLAVIGLVSRLLN